MFRKYYSEANNDIKPSDEFVNSVIEKAKKRRPPRVRRYMKRAASLAAAIAVVSAAVISMPLWQRVLERNDGVISEEVSTDTGKNLSEQADSASSAGGAADNSTDMADSTSEHSYDDTAVQPEKKPDLPQAAAVPPSPSVKKSTSPLSPTAKPTARPAVQPQQKNEPVSEKSATSPQESGGTAAEAETELSDTDMNTGGDDTPQIFMQRKIAQASSLLPLPDDTPAPESTEENASGDYTIDRGESSLYAKSASAALSKKIPAAEEPSDETDESYAYDEGMSLSASAPEEASDSASFHDDPTLPAPTGYYCTAASRYGYTFENDSGAVITVTISYGGEDTGPQYTVNGEDIYAVCVSYGMRVTINAHGADIAEVEEIIEQFR